MGTKRPLASPTESLWTAAQEALHAVLVWDDAGHRMLLCCSDRQQRLTIWQLAAAGWQLVTSGKGPGASAPLIAAYDPSAKEVRIIAGTLRESWSLAGTTLKRHSHKSPFGGAAIFASSAHWDPKGKKLLVGGGKIYSLEGKHWQPSPSPALNAEFLVTTPKHGLTAFNGQGDGARVSAGATPDITLPLSLPLLMAVASGDGTILAVTVASKGQLRVIRDSKVVKTTVVPSGTTTVAWHPERAQYIVRILDKKRAKTWAYAATKGVLTELDASKGVAVTDAPAASSLPARSAWKLVPGKGGQPEDECFSSALRGLVGPWPACGTCGGLMRHLVTAMRGPGLPLKKHEGIAVFLCEAPMCESFVANGPSNKVAFISKARRVVKGSPQGKPRPYRRVAGKAERSDDDSASDASKLGGFPAWVQTPQIVTCSTCRKPMDFVLQIGEPFETFGDGGIGYVFLCPREHAGAALWQGM